MTTIITIYLTGYIVTFFANMRIDLEDFNWCDIDFLMYIDDIICSVFWPISLIFSVYLLILHISGTIISKFTDT